MSKSTITDLPNDIRSAVPLFERNPFIMELIRLAEAGEFHDFKSVEYGGHEKTTLVYLINQSNVPELSDIRKAVINGDYDESPDAEDRAQMKKDWFEHGGSEEGYKAMFGDD